MEILARYCFAPCSIASSVEMMGNRIDRENVGVARFFEMSDDRDDRKNVG